MTTTRAVEFGGRTVCLCGRARGIIWGGVIDKEKLNGTAAVGLESGAEGWKASKKSEKSKMVVWNCLG